VVEEAEQRFVKVVLAHHLQPLDLGFVVPVHLEVHEPFQHQQDLLLHLTLVESARKLFVETLAAFKLDYFVQHVKTCHDLVDHD